MRNQDDLSDENLALIFKHIDKSFDEAQHTGVLNLSAKKLSNLPRSVTQFDLSDLHFADFSKNCLHHFPNFIFNFLSLEELDVHRNSLKSIPDSISQLKNLIDFNIASNQLTTFPAQACTLNNLQILNISSNRITSLPSDIHLLSNLMLLDASNNLLTELPENFHQLSSLQSLDLHKNHLTSLPLNISDIALLRLDISVNLITHLPESLHLMRSLELFILHDNPLVVPPPHVVLKGKDHILAYMKRLRVEQNKKKLEVVIRNSSSEHQYLGSLSASRLAQRRLDSDTCLNTHLYTPLVHHRVNPLTAGRRNVASSYATSTIDVAYHRRQKEKLADFNGSSHGKARRKSDTQSDEEDRTKIKTYRKLSVGSSGNVHMVNTDITFKSSQKVPIIKVAQSNSHHKKPPPHTTPTFYRKQVSLVDLSKRNQHKTSQNSHNKVSGNVRNNSESSSEEEDSGESSSGESNRTLSAGSPNDKSWNGSLEKVKVETKTSDRKDSDDEVKDEKKGKSIEETIKRTLMNLTQPDVINTNPKFNLSDSYEEDATTFPSTETHPSNKEQNNDGDDDEEEDVDVSDYGDGIEDDDEEDEEKKNKINQTIISHRILNNKQQRRSNNQKEEEEFVAKASALKQQREREARKIKKNLYSPPVESHTTNKGLSLKCQQMLEAMSSQLNSHDPVLTIRRNLQHSAIEKQQAKKLKRTLEDLLHCRLHGDVGDCLQDGVLLCKLVNKLFPGSVPKIHMPANHHEKLSESKSRKNVENFLIASRKLGLSKEAPQTFEAAIMALIVQLDKYINSSNGSLSEHKPILNGHNGHQSLPCSFIKHTNSHSPPTLRDKSIACFCIGFFVCTCLALFFYPLPAE